MLDIQHLTTKVNAIQNTINKQLNMVVPTEAQRRLQSVTTLGLVASLLNQVIELGNLLDQKIYVEYSDCFLGCAMVDDDRIEVTQEER